MNFLFKNKSQQKYENSRCAHVCACACMCVCLAHDSEVSLFLLSFFLHPPSLFAGSNSEEVVAQLQEMQLSVFLHLLYVRTQFRDIMRVIMMHGFSFGLLHCCVCSSTWVFTAGWNRPRAAGGGVLVLPAGRPLLQAQVNTMCNSSSRLHVQSRDLWTLEAPVSLNPKEDRGERAAWR